tara:strand:+ start:1346 stop:1813 length:468 start_codon:yes stop_codon:yes gene_type:complete
MKFNKNILINKKRFKVPNGYFNTLINNSVEKNELKFNRFKVPEKYFETIDKQQIFNKIYIDKVKYIKANFYRLTAIAAMFIGIIFLSNYFENKNKDLNSVDIMNYVNQDILILEDNPYFEILNHNDFNYNNLITENDIENYFIQSSYDLANLIFE